MIRMHVKGVTETPEKVVHVVWLGDNRDRVLLPVLVATDEATSIRSGLKNVSGQTAGSSQSAWSGSAATDLPPFIHDLVSEILEHFGSRVAEVRIIGIGAEGMVADTVIGTGPDQFYLKTRPGDAIALALRSRSPIYVSEMVIEDAVTMLRRQGGVLGGWRLTRRAARRAHSDMSGFVII